MSELFVHARMGAGLDVRRWGGLDGGADITSLPLQSGDFELA